MHARLHATCVAIGERGVLLLGKSGSGKSDLALRLIDRGAVLVSDDGTDVSAIEGALVARPPATIAGQIEARGIGILTLPFRPTVPLALGIALDRPVARMPDEPLPMLSVAGMALPLVALSAFDASAPFKVEQALLLYGSIR